MDKIQDGPRRAKEVEVCRKNEGRVFTAKDEVFTVNFWTDRLLFCLSELPPGGKSPRDPGHKDADEAYYILKGTLVMEFPALNRCEKLYAGDSILVPQDQPHIMINPGEETTISVVATAPNLGYDISELTGSESESES